MTVYSINDLEKLTGIKAHTLRIWEKRYGILEPRRTATNIRYYEDEDIKKLLNVALLNRHGYKISTIAGMPQEEILEKVSDLTMVDIDPADQLDALTLSMIELDEDKFNRIIDKHTTQRGFEEMLFDIFFPLLDKVSSMWMSGSFKRVHEYFLSNMISRKVVAAIESLGVKESRAPQQKVLIFLTGESIYELSFMLSHYMLRNRGFRVVNIGEQVLPQDILDAVTLCKPDYLFTFHAKQIGGEDFDSLLSSLIGHGVRKPIIVSGVPPGERDARFENVVKLGTLEQTIAYFEMIAGM